MFSAKYKLTPSIPSVCIIAQGNYHDAVKHTLRKCYFVLGLFRVYCPPMYTMRTQSTLFVYLKVTLRILGTQSTLFVGFGRGVHIQMAPRVSS